MATFTTDADYARLAVLEINRNRADSQKLPDDMRDEAEYYIGEGRKFLAAHFTYDPTASTGDAANQISRALIEYAKAFLLGVDFMSYEPFLRAARVWAHAAAIENIEAQIAAAAAS